MSKKSILAESHYTREDKKYSSFQRKRKCTGQANILKYERRHLKMSNSNRNNPQRTTGTQQTDSQLGVVSTQPVSQILQQRESLFDKKSIVSAIVSTVASTFIISIVALIISAVQSPKAEMNEIKKSIEQLTLNDAVMQTNIEYLQENTKQLQNKLYASNDINKPATKLMPTQLMRNSVDTSISNISASMPVNLCGPTWASVDVLARDSSGKEYTAEQLKNEKLLLPYESNGQEVYFYGQFNENNQWDGECVINVYKDNALILLTEAMYNNGVIQSYKQVLTIDKNDKKAWIISDRVNRGDYNSGESWRYHYDKDQTSIKSFDIETVVNNDIVFVDEFKQSLKTKLEGYYYGNTSDGMYNDTTGTAYLVKYDENGFIRTLYSGNFKDGKFEDNTGNAWYITRNVDTDTEYMYYKGNFSNGSPTRKSKYDFKNNLTREDINIYMKGKVFNCEIAWAETQSMKSNN